ncbi:MAG: metal ABC transporter permease [Nitrospirae bacterium]|nr:metal ABC transporter permease [Nitrospirota bacterium]
MELFAFDFMQRAFVAGLSVSLLCSVLSLFVLLKRMAFAGIGISHAALGGVSLGLLTGVSPLLTTLAVCVAAALGIGAVTRGGRINEDAAIGILSTGIMALGVVLVGFSDRYQGDLYSYLFGNILAVDTAQLWELLGVLLLVLGFVATFFKELLFVSYDEEVAQVTGIPARALYFGLLVAIACTVVAAIHVVGLVLASALLVIPAAIGYQLAANWRGILVIAIVSGWLAVAGGLVLSFYWDVATGGTIVLILVFLFFAAFLLARIGLAPQPAKGA